MHKLVWKTVKNLGSGSLLQLPRVVLGKSLIHLLLIFNFALKKFIFSVRYGNTYIKTETVQRRLAWPLHKDDTQIHEAFHAFVKNVNLIT